MSRNVHTISQNVQYKPFLPVPGNRIPGGHTPDKKETLIKYIIYIFSGTHAFRQTGNRASCNLVFQYTQTIFYQFPETGFPEARSRIKKNFLFSNKFKYFDIIYVKKHQVYQPLLLVVDDV